MNAVDNDIIEVDLAKTFKWTAKKCLIAGAAAVVVAVLVVASYRLWPQYESRSMLGLSSSGLEGLPAARMRERGFIELRKTTQLRSAARKELDNTTFSNHDLPSCSVRSVADMLELSVRADDPELAQSAAGAWTAAFLKFDQQRIKSAAQTVCEQLGSRLTKLEKDRASIEQQYSVFMDNHTGDNQTFVLRETQLLQLQNSYNNLEMDYHSGQIKLAKTAAATKEYKQQWANETDAANQWIAALSTELPTQVDQPSPTRPQPPAAEKAMPAKTAADKLQKYRRQMRDYITSPDAISAEINSTILQGLVLSLEEEKLRLESQRKQFLTEIDRIKTTLTGEDLTQNQTQLEAGSRLLQKKIEVLNQNLDNVTSQLLINATNARLSKQVEMELTEDLKFVRAEYDGHHKRFMDLYAKFSDSQVQSKILETQQQAAREKLNDMEEKIRALNVRLLKDKNTEGRLQDQLTQVKKNIYLIRTRISDIQLALAQGGKQLQLVAQPSAARQISARKEAMAYSGVAFVLVFLLLVAVELFFQSPSSKS